MRKSILRYALFGKKKLRLSVFECRFQHIKQHLHAHVIGGGAFLFRRRIKGKVFDNFCGGKLQIFLALFDFHCCFVHDFVF